LKHQKPSKKELIAEAKALFDKNDRKPFSRDWFRTHSRFGNRWGDQFAKFAAFMEEAKLPTVGSTSDTSLPPEHQLELEKEKVKAKQAGVGARLKSATERIVLLEKNLEVALSLKKHNPQVTIIAPKTPSTGSESVAVTIASDWHIEENVAPATVSYKNEFNLKIGDKRATKYWQGVHRMYDILRRDTAINTLVVALLGDFITNHIHEEFLENNNLLPMEAVYKVEGMLRSGLKFLLENVEKDVRFVIPCHYGNHSRTTEKTRGVTEAGHSLERLIYYHLRDLFEGEDRLQFQIAEGYHSWIGLFDNKYRIRCHHGHAINFNGGIGGVEIPINRALAQWDMTQQADLDIFGHFHRLIDNSKFVMNGSLIGYNDFAVRIRAPYQKPQQAFFLVNRKWNSKSVFTPIFLE
jgi:hypothetical protein